MTRILIAAVGIALLLTGRAWAQSEANCEEIRQAIATYGYEEARKHALIHYGQEAVESSEKKCLIREASTQEVAPKRPAKHQQAKKHKPGTPSVQARKKSSVQAQQGETPRPPRPVGN
jgi:hypothetical protein